MQGHGDSTGPAAAATENLNPHRRMSLHLHSALSSPRFGNYETQGNDWIAPGSGCLISALDALGEACGCVLASVTGLYARRRI